MPRLLAVIGFAALLLGAWSRRWISDDGFIYLRVARNIASGHGPVFNLGERVEVATGPAWPWLLALAHGVTGVPFPYLAVALGILLTVTGFAVAALTVLRVAPPASPVNIGPLLAWALFPPVWDFATSGLESGLTLFWLAASTALLMRAPYWMNRPSHCFLGGVLFGIGALIRPDLFLISVVLTLAALWLLLQSARSPIASTVALLAAVLLPLASYQLFRMGYYRLLVPNTYLAKEAFTPRWDQGLSYLLDLHSFPLVAVTSSLLLLHGLRHLTGRLGYRAGPDPRRTALLLSALSYALLVVRAGGDFMRARLLLPSLFMLLLFLCLTDISGAAKRALNALPLVALLPSLVPATGSNGFVPWIADERSVYAYATGIRHPIEVTDFDRTVFPHQVAAVRELSQHVGYGFVLVQPNDQVVLDTTYTAGNRVVFVPKNLGVTGFSVSSDVYVIDRLALADPIGSHLSVLRRGRPGHEKWTDDSWILARHSDATGANAAVQSARFAIDCSGLAEYLEGISAPLTLSQFLSNARGSIEGTFLRLPPDPAVAAAVTCRDVGEEASG